MCGCQVASPEGAPNLALRELAVKLVTLVASGSSGAAFQTAVAALSPEAKQRLQVDDALFIAQLWGVMWLEDLL